MICVFSIFILLKGVNLDPKRHSLFTSVLPGSKFCADAVYLENESGWNGFKVLSTDYPSTLLPFRCWATGMNSRSFKRNSHILLRCLLWISNCFKHVWLSFHKSSWALLNFVGMGSAPFQCPPRRQDLLQWWAHQYSSFLCLSPTPTPDWTHGPQPCVGLNPQQPSPRYSEPLLFALYCHHPNSSQLVTSLLFLRSSTRDPSPGELPQSTKPTPHSTCIHLNSPVNASQFTENPEGNIHFPTTSAHSCNNTMVTAPGHGTVSLTRPW